VGPGRTTNGSRVPWPKDWTLMHISPKELVPNVMAVALWGPYWSGQRICCYCDNSAVVFTVNKGSTRDPQLMRLMRALYFCCTSYNVTISARHIPGVLNTSADALSRGNLPTFLALNPQASPQPAVVPADLLELVFNRGLLWTSPSWTKLFNSTLTTVSPHPRERPTPPHSVDSWHSAKSIS